jgi:hypothetical protein
MKTLPRILFAAALALGLAAVPLPAATPGAGGTAGKAVVVSIEGEASVEIPGEAPQPLVKGMEIQAGATVVTSARSTVVLDLGENGQLLSVKPGSRLFIDRLQIQKQGAGTVADTHLEVKKGSILGNVKKLPPGSQYTVKTANGVAGIRGTIFTCSITRVSCGTGLVTFSVTRPDGQSQSFDVSARTFLELSGANPSQGNLSPAELGAILADGRNLMNFLGSLTTGFNSGNVKQHVQTASIPAQSSLPPDAQRAANQLFNFLGNESQAFERFVQREVAGINGGGGAGRDQFRNQLRDALNSQNNDIIQTGSRERAIERFRAAGFLPTTIGDFVENVGGLGLMRGQMIWRNASDMDLHLILPNGQEVYYGNTDITFSGDGQTARAQLDADNLGGVINQAPDVRAENIVVNPTGGSTRLPPGNYEFFIRNFSDNGGTGSTTATLLLTGDGAQTIQTHTVTVADRQNSPRFIITVPPAAGGGSL